MVAVLTFIVILSLLILVHEGGHFLAARKFGIWVEEFGLGLPPRVFGRRRGNTIFSLNWLPIGGFVRLHGENLEESIQRPSEAFLNKSKLVRSIVVCAGVFMNLIFGLLAFSVIYTISGIPRETATGEVRVVGVEENSAAKGAGILPGDIVKNIDGLDVKTTIEFIEKVNSKRGQKIELVVERKEEDETKTLNIAADLKDVPADRGSLGVSISSSDIEYYFPPIWQRPFLGIYYGFKEAIFWGKAIVSGLVSLGTDVSRGQVPKDIAGPVGIYKISSEVCGSGILNCVNFMGVLSVNLAIINILPIPALDGGRFLFIIIEAITRRRVTPKIEATIHAVGMIALLLLILFITIIDIKRLAVANQLPAFLMQFFK